MCQDRPPTQPIEWEWLKPTEAVWKRNAAPDNEISSMEVGRIANYRCSTRSMTDQVLRPGRSRPSFYTASPLTGHWPAPTGTAQAGGFLPFPIAHL